MTGNQLKMLALLAMTIDHVGLILLPQYAFLRGIGRLAYPIFAYMIAEGCFYTRNKPRYLGGIAILGAACQLVFWFVSASLEQSILTTFFLAILVVYALQELAEKPGLRSAALFVLAVCLAYFACCVLPGVLRTTGFFIDYGFWGVCLPALCYLPRVLVPQWSASRRRLVTLAFLALGLVLVACSMLGFMHGMQWWSLAAVPVLTLYNGKRGKCKMKYFFYVYYPAHLVCIYALHDLL